MNNFTNIPLPQDTRLYQVSGGVIVKPKISFESLIDSCSYGSYSNLQNTQLIYEVYNQNINEINLSFNDLSISSIAGANSYFDLNGYNNGFDYRFINFSSPTVVFAPVVIATDNGSDVGNMNGAGLNTVISANSLSYQGLKGNNYILLTNQQNPLQNLIYRIVSIAGNSITVYNDATVNSILTQNPNYIFTRVLVSNSYGMFYYGLLNSTISGIAGYNWVSQTQGLMLPSAKYGLTLYSELTSNNLSINYFSANNVVPVIGDVIAINILPQPGQGGKTSGVYIVNSVTNNQVNISPVYPQYIFSQQFVKIQNDFSTNTPNVWIVDPTYVGSKTYFYSAQPFAFKSYSTSNIVSSPSLWARQVGNPNDTIVGFTLYNQYMNNSFIQNSDIFSICVSIPNWVDNNATVKGLNIKATYSTNLTNVTEEASII